MEVYQHLSSNFIAQGIFRFLLVAKVAEIVKAPCVSQGLTGFRFEHWTPHMTSSATLTVGVNHLDDPFVFRLSAQYKQSLTMLRCSLNGPPKSNSN